MDNTVLRAAQAAAAAFWRAVRDGGGAPPKVGLALGGGFARGIAHVGVLRVLERRGISVHMIAGVSAGSIVAAAYASGASPDEIGRAGCAMRLADVARWRVGRMGLAGSERMEQFLRRILKTRRFEEMRIPLAVVASDLARGEPAIFRGHGDVCLPIRASCSYPGLFQPVLHEGRWLVDGAMTMEMPARVLREMGATYVISVSLPAHANGTAPQNAFQVINRCFQIMQSRLEAEWRSASDLVIEPDVRGVAWDAFGCGEQLIAAGEEAAEKSLQRTTLSAQPGKPSAVRGQRLRWLRADG
jgi:NTE family protein